MGQVPRTIWLTGPMDQKPFQPSYHRPNGAPAKDADKFLESSSGPARAELPNRIRVAAHSPRRLQRVKRSSDGGA